MEIIRGGVRVDILKMCKRCESADIIEIALACLERTHEETRLWGTYFFSNNIPAFLRSVSLIDNTALSGNGARENVIFDAVTNRPLIVDL